MVVMATAHSQLLRVLSVAGAAATPRAARPERPRRPNGWARRRSRLPSASGRLLRATNASGCVVRIGVLAAITELLHEPRRRVAQVQRNRLRAVLLDRLERAPERAVGGVALGRAGEVGDRLGERDPALGQADPLGGEIRGGRDAERAGIGVADVLGREDHEPAREEEQIVAGREQARGVVERRVRIARAQALDERRGEVVVLLAVAVVRAACAGRPPRAPLRARRARRARAAGDRRGRLEDAERAPRVAVRGVRDRRDRVVAERDAPAEPALGVGRRAPHDARERLLVERARARTRGSARAAARSPRTTGSRWSRRSASRCRARRAAAACPAARGSGGGSRRGTARCGPRWCCARSTTARISFTPAVTAESGSKCAPTASASSRAIVVLPQPGGPQRISDGSVARVDQRAQPGAAREQLRPARPSRRARRGRMRSASGAGGRAARLAALAREQLERFFAGGHAQSLATCDAPGVKLSSVGICVKRDQPQVAERVADARGVAARSRRRGAARPRGRALAGRARASSSRSSRRASIC